MARWTNAFVIRWIRLIQQRYRPTPISTRRMLGKSYESVQWTCWGPVTHALTCAQLIQYSAVYRFRSLSECWPKCGTRQCLYEQAVFCCVVVVWSLLSHYGPALMLIALKVPLREMCYRGRDSSRQKTPVPKCPNTSLTECIQPIVWLQCRNVLGPKCPGSEVSWHRATSSKSALMHNLITVIFLKVLH